MEQRLCLWRALKAHLGLQKRQRGMRKVGVIQRFSPLKSPAWWLGRGKSYNFQGLGIGSGLLRVLVELAAKNGAPYVWGQITDPDKVGWYERRGFTFNPIRSRVRRAL